MANRKRNKHINVRLTENEFKTVSELSEKSGMTKQAYMLKSALKSKINVLENGSELIKHLTRIGTNINQIAKIANTTSEIDSKAIQELRQEVEKIWRQLSLFHTKKVAQSDN